MKIIDLLNKIANNDNPPKKIKFGGVIYTRYNDDIDYENQYGGFLMDSAVCICPEDLNEEVEIIEPQEHKIPEKLTETTLYGVPILNKKKLSNITLTNKRDIVDIKDKINEILDYLKEIK